MIYSLLQYCIPSHSLSVPTHTPIGLPMAGQKVKDGKAGSMYTEWPREKLLISNQSFPWMGLFTWLYYIYPATTFKEIAETL